MSPTTQQQTAWRGLVLAALFFVAACSKQPNEDRRPTSSLSRGVATALAYAAQRAHPSLTVHSVSETHSMEPVIYGNVIALAEPARIGAIVKGDIILWGNGTQPVRMHQVYSNDGIRLGVRGVNNLTSDNSDTHFITDTDLIGRYVGHFVFDPNKP
jgi:hypothetical protein